MKISFDTKKNMPKDYFTTIIAPLNEQGGEAVRLEVDVYNSGITNTHLVTHCYGVSSSRISLFQIPLESLQEACNKIKENIDKMKQLRAKLHG